MSAELSTLFKVALIAVVAVVVAVLVVVSSLFYGCRFTVTACSTCIKYVAYFVEHGRAHSERQKVAAIAIAIAVAFHAVNYYYRRVSVHLSGLSGAGTVASTTTQPTTCNKTALRQRHRHPHIHTHMHIKRDSKVDRHST